MYIMHNNLISIAREDREEYSILMYLSLHKRVLISLSNTVTILKGGIGIDPFLALCAHN